MTYDEAQTEAVRRWGKNGIARDRLGYYSPPLLERFMVGVVNHLNTVMVHGEGDCWEAAFADASSRAEFMKDYF